MPRHNLGNADFGVVCGCNKTKLISGTDDNVELYYVFWNSCSFKDW